MRALLRYFPYVLLTFAIATVLGWGLTCLFDWRLAWPGDVSKADVLLIWVGILAFEQAQQADPYL